MNPKHTNPQEPRYDSKTGKPVWATAPYNFVPLPDSLVLAQPPLWHDSFNLEGSLTGWIDCQFETRSPTYVRGMLTQKDFEEFGEKEPDQIKVVEKEKGAPFFSTSRRKKGAFNEPVIPGSSLRGMIRSLVEVAGYGKPNWVMPKPTFTYRAVAAPSNDPLRKTYNEVMGAFSKNVRAGYLEQSGEDWYIYPAQTPEQVGFKGKDTKAFLKVKEAIIRGSDIEGFIPLLDKKYIPQYYAVSFTTEQRHGKQGEFPFVATISSDLSRYPHQGTLVCSGNMLETEAGIAETPAAERKTRRKNHTLILARSRIRIPIDPQAVRDYIDGLTPYQSRLANWGGSRGVLKHGAPVFYVEPLRGEKVQYFGHSPNFRIPARQPGATRASNPADFIPPSLKSDRPDLAEAIFGWVEEKGSSLTGQYAGRVSIGDASYAGDAHQGDIWFQSQPIIPHILAGPKPTTFQNYLVQDASLGHSPEQKEALAHYGTPGDQTQIRGHKFYWIKGQAPDIEASSAELGGSKDGKPGEYKHESQLQRIVPLKPGVTFQFRINFENLRPEELGALGWVLSLPGAEGKTYCHRIGMGKPYGMGAIQVKSATLHLTDRTSRYSHLFGKADWFTGETPAELAAYTRQFETYVLGRVASGNANDQSPARLADLERIQHLLAMLEWREGSAAWTEQTRYLKIKRETDNLNEYKERPVLPTALGVVSRSEGAPIPQSPASPPVTEKRSQAPAQKPPSPPARAASYQQLKEGQRVTTQVEFIDDNGDAYLQVESIPTEQALGRLRAQSLGQRKLITGDNLVCRVVKIEKEFNDLIISCELPPVGVDQTGVVLSYGVDDKPYGKITPDDGGKEIFVHRNDLRPDLEKLERGQHVAYHTGRDHKGRLVANDVHLAPEEPK